MDAPTSHEVTRLLGELNRGNRDAIDVLMPLVYDELRRIAGRHLSHERQDHTLQPTALVHEAFLRMVDQDSASGVLLRCAGSIISRLASCVSTPSRIAPTTRSRLTS